MSTKRADTQRDAAWGKRLSALMDAAGIGAEELARKMRCARSTAYHWRNGTRVPSREVQPRLAKHLGVSVAVLNGWVS